MAKITGVGGVFFKTKGDNAEALLYGMSRRKTASGSAQANLLS